VNFLKLFNEIDKINQMFFFKVGIDVYGAHDEEVLELEQEQVAAQDEDLGRREKKARVELLEARKKK
jgi:hypothetical protein